MSDNIYPVILPINGVYPNGALAIPGATNGMIRVPGTQQDISRALAQIANDAGGQQVYLRYIVEPPDLIQYEVPRSAVSPPQRAVTPDDIASVYPNRRQTARQPQRLIAATPARPNADANANGRANRGQNDRRGPVTLGTQRVNKRNAGNNQQQQQQQRRRRNSSAPQTQATVSTDSAPSRKRTHRGGRGREGRGSGNGNGNGNGLQDLAPQMPAARDALPPPNHVKG